MAGDEISKKHNLVPRVLPPGGGKLSYNYNESMIANDFLNLLFYALNLSGKTVSMA